MHIQDPIGVPLPRMSARESGSKPQESLLEVHRLVKHFPGGSSRKNRPVVRAVDGVSFDIQLGETLGLVGESGSGKTTVGRLIARLLDPTEGSILLNGVDVTAWGEDRLRKEFRRNVQMIFQDTLGSLNPRTKVRSIIGQPLQLRRELSQREIRERVSEMITQVGLPEELGDSYPHELTGAERQRVGIATALSVNPKLIIADEPVSALDVSMQAQILNVLMELRDRLGVSLLFISHDLSAVRHISDRVAVMYLGELVEIAPTKALFSEAEHPYTQALLSAIPSPNPDLRRVSIVLEGEIPSPMNPPPGCRFHTRCPLATAICRRVAAELEAIGANHHVACHFSPEREPGYLASRELEELRALRTPELRDQMQRLKEAHRWA